MKLKRSIKKILSLTGWCLLVIGFIVVLIAATDKQDNIYLIGEVQVNINYNEGLYFVSENDIKTMVNEHLESPLEAFTINELNIGELEENILTNPYIKKADAFTDATGALIINVIQRKPIVRVINRNGVSYYIDNYGDKIPISSNFTARVPVSNGEIYDNGLNTGPVESQLLKDLYELSKYIHNDKYLSALVEQVYVNEEKEFEIIPKIENHTIVIGGVDKLDEKFRKLYIFYREGLRNVGRGKYAQVDLRFDNQIVCKKR